ncbi:hypothetical protein AB0903_19665 [Streptomyces sp. NPDC048389]|uniref:hypothetical protein n=1 Tax=Streptomyces sp. NPDC048389 TaxID=3154622 RepID=UPI0034551C99
MGTHAGNVPPDPGSDPAPEAPPAPGPGPGPGTRGATGTRTRTRTRYPRRHRHPTGRLPYAVAAGPRCSPDPDLGGERSRVPVDRYLGEYAADDREGLREHLTEGGLRHIAARGWSMPDGTSARIFLLRFHTSALAGHFFGRQLGGAPDTTVRPTGVEEVSSFDGD